MTKFLNVIQATLKANYKKPAYWARVDYWLSCRNGLLWC